MRGFAVAARPPRFLEVVFNAFGHIDVCDKPHVGFVNTHTESNRCADHGAGRIDKPRLIVVAHLTVHSGVIRPGINPAGHEFFGRALSFGARQTVDNAAFAPVLIFNKVRELVLRMIFFDNPVADVGAVKACDKAFGIDQKPLTDFFPGREVCGGG